MDKARKKTIKRIIALICIVAVVGLLAAMPLIAKQEAEEDGPKASILSGNVELGSIETEVLGGGTLTEEDVVTVSVPTAVLLKEFLVSNGEYVIAGTPIATVDPVSTMNAIIGVQETLDHLAEEIEDATDAEEETTVTSLTGGTVKILYAEVGDSVQNVMLEHGALAVLSLDGLMAVDLETDATLSASTTVTVTLPNGTAVEGKVERNLLGKMTVTVEDDAYTVGEIVEISDSEGNFIGSGELYIYSPWNVTAYAGAVSAVKVSEEDSVKAGASLFTLTDVGNTATYGQLVGQRRTYEALLSRLFTLYRTQVVIAPCDGIVSAIDTSSAQLMAVEETTVTNAQTMQMTATTEASYGIVLLSNVTVKTENEMTLPATTEPATDSSNGAQDGGTTGSTDGFGGMGGFTGTTGGFTGGMGGFTGGFGGSTGTTTTEPEFELYSTEETAVAQVTPPNTMTLEITVDESDVSALQLGMEAEIRMDALGGEKTTAVITEIGNTGSGNGGSSKYTVKLTMARRENMLPGMTAGATIVLSITERVLTVPASALVEVGNETVVYTAYDEEHETLLNPVTVEVGISDGKTVEILSGLSEGQTYYYAYYDTLEVSYVPDFGGGMSFFGR